MLDKSLPYIDIIMRRNPAPPPVPALPPGYRFGFFGENGDEKSIRDWAEIEASVLEFDDTGSAEKYFRREFLPYKNELYRRMRFIITTDGRRVGTATSWWQIYNGIRNPWVHWVAVRPEFQSKGLGRALIYEVTRLMHEIEGETYFYLHTQTWSYKAVFLYESAGFEITVPCLPVCRYSSERLEEARAIINSYRR